MSKAPHIVFTGLCIIWGSTWLGIKVGLDYLPPFLFAGLRFAVATIVLVFFARLLHARIPRDRSGWFLMGFLGIFQLTIPYGLVFWGEQYISSGLAAVLFATLPFFVALFAHYFVGERLTTVKVVGIVASFAGLVAIFWGDISIANISTRASLLGGIAVVVSTASAAIANVVAKKYAAGIDPSFNVLVQSAICTIALLTLSVITESSAHPVFNSVAVGAILYLGVFGSALAFVGLYWLLTQTTVTNTSLLAFITPILALILGWLVLSEVPDQNTSVGTVLILAGIYLTLNPSVRIR
jgi:drug/metabolite transporter (DMT)-like permease